MTFAFVSHGIIIGTVREGYMPVPDVVKEMNLVLVQHQTGSNGMNGRVSPSLVEEAAILVQLVEEVEIWLRSQPVEIADLEVGPLDTVSRLQQSGG